MSKKILFVFVLALILRICFIQYYPQQIIQNDSLDYLSVAEELIEGHGLSTYTRVRKDIPAERISIYDEINSKAISKSEIIPLSRRMPGYSVFLAMVFKYISPKFDAVRWVQGFLSLLVCLGVYLFALQLFGRKVALFSLGVSSIYPPFISYAGLYLTEILSTFLSVIFFNLIAWIVIKKDDRWASPFVFLVAVVLSVAIYVRSDSIYLVACVVPIVFFAYDKKRVFFQAVVVLGLVCAFMSPWVIRNYKTFGEFMPLSGDGGLAFWIGSIPSDLTNWGEDPVVEKKGHAYAIVSGKPAQTSKRYIELALENISNHPIRWIYLCFKRTARLWIGSHSNSISGLEVSLVQAFKKGKWDIFGLKFTLLIFNTLLVLCGFLVVFLDKKKWHLLSIFLFILASKTVLHALTFGSVRYQLGVMPIMIVFACKSVQVMLYDARE